MGYILVPSPSFFGLCFCSQWKGRFCVIYFEEGSTWEQVMRVQSGVFVKHLCGYWFSIPSPFSYWCSEPTQCVSVRFLLWSTAVHHGGVTWQSHDPAPPTAIQSCGWDSRLFGAKLPADSCGEWYTIGSRDYNKHVQHSPHNTLPSSPPPIPHTHTYAGAGEWRFYSLWLQRRQWLLVVQISRYSLLVASIPT